MRETWVQSLGWKDPPGEGKGCPLQYYGWVICPRSTAHPAWEVLPGLSAGRQTCSWASFKTAGPLTQLSSLKSLLRAPNSLPIPFQLNKQITRVHRLSIWELFILPSLLWPLQSANHLWCSEDDWLPGHVSLLSTPSLGGFYTLQTALPHVASTTLVIQLGPTLCDP